MQISEQEFEDWVCDHIEDVAGPDARVIGRQVHLQDGTRLDVLAERPDPGDPAAAQVVVIELKADQAHVAALTQLLGYMGHLTRAIHAGASAGHPDASERIASVAGILAAPGGATEPAVLMIDGLPNVDLVGLAVAIRATLARPTEHSPRLDQDEEMGIFLARAVGTTPHTPATLPAEDWLEAEDLIMAGADADDRTSLLSAAE